jgi:hypothetical protein
VVRSGGERVDEEAKPPEAAAQVIIQPALAVYFIIGVCKYN